MRVKTVEAIEDFKLKIVSDSDVEGIFDVFRFIEAEAFQPLKNRIEFEKVRTGGYYIEWECGADLCASTIFEYWELIK